jgi:DNA polymerase IV (DinB-like DNA polymerase)
MDYFYAQCEELRNPSYANKPIVVGMYSGRTEISGAVATSNYAARKYGVKSGIPLARAKSILKGVDSLFVKADFAYYEKMSSRIMSIIKEYSDIFLQASIDEAFIDVSSRTGGSFELAEALAKEIKDRILRETKIACSIGVGPNRLIAKMACDDAKPGGLKVVRPGEVSAFLAEKPVEALYGIGNKTAEKLKEMNILKIKDLAEKPLHLLQSQFGPKLGLYFFLASKGVDDEPLVEHEREQIGRIVTLKEDTRKTSKLTEPLEKMALEISTELSAENLAFKTVTLVVIDSNLKQHTRSKTLRVAESNVLSAVPVALSLAEEFFAANRNTAARRIGLTVSSLVKQQKQTPLTAYFEKG